MFPVCSSFYCRVRSEKGSFGLAWAQGYLFAWRGLKAFCKFLDIIIILSSFTLQLIALSLLDVLLWHLFCERSFQWACKLYFDLLVGPDRIAGVNFDLSSPACFSSSS